MMNDLMRAEILDQPEALSKSLASLRGTLASLDLPAGANRRVLFSGSGDSLCAPLALQYAARLHSTEDIHVLSAMEAAAYWPFSKQDLLVAISVTGSAIRTVQAATVARESGAAVLAITANEQSRLAQVATHRLVLPVRSRSRQTPHTTDYLTTLLAIGAVIEKLSQRRLDVLDALPEVVGQVIEASEHPAVEIAEASREKEKFYFLGAGPHFATAQYAAAKFWEAGGIRAYPFELEEFAHGPHFVVDPGDVVVVLAPAGNSLTRAREILNGLKALGVALVVVTDTDADFPGCAVLRTRSLPEEWSPFVLSIPLQWLCWALANVQGYDVVTKAGRLKNPESYEAAHREWVRPTAGNS